MIHHPPLELSADALPGVTAALAGAAATGLVDALLRGTWEPAELARECDLDERAVQRVLEVLAAIGLSAFDDGRWSAGPLLRAAEESVPGGASRTARLWTGIVDYLRRGTHGNWSSGPLPERGQNYRQMVTRLARYFEAASAELADALGPATRLLDVGAGAGVWSLEMARRNEHTTVDGLDLPEVCEAFSERARALGLEARARALAGDYHAVPLDAGHYDRIVIANVLRIEPRDRAAALVSRLAGALAPDGELVVVDVPDAGRPERALARAVYRLHLALRSNADGPHPATDIIEWMRTAGLPRVERVDLARGPAGEAAWIARR